MFSLFCYSHHVTFIFANLNNTDQNFLDFVIKYLYKYDVDDENLSIPVYSCIKPSMGPEFIWNTLLSLGIFSTERKLLLNGSLRVCFCNAKLIRKEDYPESLKNYSDQVMNIFVNNQFVFFTNGKRMIEDFIIHDGYL